MTVTALKILLLQLSLPLCSFLIKEKRDMDFLKSGISTHLDFRAERYAFYLPYDTVIGNLVYLHLFIILSSMIYLLYRKYDKFYFALPVFTITFYGTMMGFTTAVNSYISFFSLFSTTPAIIFSVFMFYIGKQLDHFFLTHKEERYFSKTSLMDVFQHLKIYLIGCVSLVGYLGTRKEVFWSFLMGSGLFHLLFLGCQGIFIYLSVKSIKNFQREGLTYCKFALPLTFDLPYASLLLTLLVNDTVGFASGLFLVYSFLPALISHCFFAVLGWEADKTMKKGKKDME